MRRNYFWKSPRRNNKSDGRKKIKIQSKNHRSFVLLGYYLFKFILTFLTMRTYDFDVHFCLLWYNVKSKKLIKWNRKCRPVQPIDYFVRKIAHTSNISIESSIRFHLELYLNTADLELFIILFKQRCKLIELIQMISEVKWLDKTIMCC